MFNSKGYFLFLLVKSLSLSRINCQDIPPIAPTCSHLFQYLFQNGNFIGRLSLSDIQLGWITVEVYFSQQGDLESDYTGSILLRPDVETINNVKENTAALTYHIDFPMKTVVPKLTKIEVNNKVLCAANEIRPPSTSFKMQHTVRITTEAFDVPKSVEINSTEYTPESKQQTTVGLSYDSHIKPIILTKNSQQTSKHLFLKNNCGYGGVDYGSESTVNYGEYPWLAAIYKKEANRSTFFHGGTLISSRTVLTSAHYFIRNKLMADDIIASLGRHNLDDPLENNIQRDIKTLLIHPEYKSGYYFPDADIALLQLLAPVGFDQYVKPICIWDDDTDESLEGQSGIIVGWNIVSAQKMMTLMVPKKLDVTVISDEECATEYAFNALRTSRTFCAATNEGTGPCGGGDGLIFNRNGRWVLRAVVSTGLAQANTCDLNQYVIYCDIAKHASWIQSYMLP